MLRPRPRPGQGDDAARTDAPPCQVSRMTPLSRRRFGALALALFGAARVGLPAAPPATLFAFAIAGGMFHALRRREVRAAPTPGLALTLRR